MGQFSSLLFAYKITAGVGTFLAGVLLKWIAFPTQAKIEDVEGIEKTKQCKYIIKNKELKVEKCNYYRCNLQRDNFTIWKSTIYMINILEARI